jgi:hypothetical protein
MPLTAKQILKSSFPIVRQSSEHVKISAVKPGVLKSGAPKLVATAYSTHDANGKPKREKEKYKCAVYGLSRDSRLFEGPVKVSCNCAYFTYTCEVALHKKGAADIIHSNGEDPDDKNPAYKPSPCKHLYVVLQQIIQSRV